MRPNSNIKDESETVRPTQLLGQEATVTVLQHKFFRANSATAVNSSEQNDPRPNRLTWQQGLAQRTELF